MSSKKFPIRYAVMPIKSENDWLEKNLANDVLKEVGYIVSKVYLLGDRKLNFFNGTSRTEYEVVFPYQTPENLNNRIVPEYGIDEFYSNSEMIDNVYATYDAAAEVAELKNAKIKRKLEGSIVCTKDDLLKKIHDVDIIFDNKLAKYKEFENLILLLSVDLKVEIDDVFIKLSDFVNFYENIKRELTNDERKKLLEYIGYNSETLDKPKVLTKK